MGYNSSPPPLPKGSIIIDGKVKLISVKFYPKCSYCHVRIDENSIFCPNCGAPVLETKPIGKLQTK